LGVSMGTVAGGWFIATNGLQDLPWVGAAFGVLAFAMMVFRELSDQRAAKTSGENSNCDTPRLAA
ncbi:MAG TPA: hypothetical protein VIG72_14825, partial [Pontibacter sp.]